MSGPTSNPVFAEAAVPAAVGAKAAGVPDRGRYTVLLNDTLESTRRTRRLVGVVALLGLFLLGCTFSLDVLAIHLLKDIEVDEEHGSMVSTQSGEALATATALDSVTFDDFYLEDGAVKQALAESMERVTITYNTTTLRLGVEGYRYDAEEDVFDLFLARGASMRFTQTEMSITPPGEKDAIVVAHAEAEADAGEADSTALVAVDDTKVHRRKLKGLGLLVGGGFAVGVGSYHLARRAVFTCKLAKSAMACGQYEFCVKQDKNFPYRLYQAANQGRSVVRKVVKMKKGIECEDVGGSWFGSPNFANCGGTGLVADAYWHSFMTSLIARNLHSTKVRKDKASKIALDYMNTRESCAEPKPPALLHKLMDENNNRVGAELMRSMTRKRWWRKEQPPSKTQLSTALLNKLCSAKLVYYSGSEGTQNWNDAKINARTEKYDGSLWVIKGGLPSWC